MRGPTRKIKQRRGLTISRVRLFPIVLIVLAVTESASAQVSAEDPTRLGGASIEALADNEEPDVDGHQRMLELLREIKDRVPVEHPYLGNAASNHSKSQLAALPPNAPNVERFELNLLVGSHELLLGENQKAIQQFGDVDNDGFPDFYLGTGYASYEGLMPNLLFRNRGGTGFSDVTTAAGVGHLQKGHGVAFADFDNDGDQDIFIQLGGAYAGDAFGNALFQNPGFGHHWITLKLVGKKSNRSAIGARIRVEIEEEGKKRSVYKWVNSGGSFGANPLRQEIGVGKVTKIDVLEVFWPTSGRTQKFRDLAVDQFIEITEGASEYRKLPWKTAKFRSRRQPLGAQ